MNPNAFDQGDAGPGWADALVILPWRLYQFTGDKRLILENYPFMVAWHRSLVRISKDNLLEQGGFGDWVSVVKTPEQPIGSAYYYYSTHLLARMAEAIGKTEDAQKYTQMAQRIAQAFNQQHLDTATKNYWAGTQTANLLPLAFGITPPQEVEQVVQNIVSDVQKRNTHVTTGFLGTQYILPMLSKYGHHELAYQLATQRTAPSWGYMVDQGATTIWELWNSDTEGPDMNSRNHYAYGTVGEWFYRYLGGIQSDDQRPGFRHILLAPQPAGDLSWAEISFESGYGLIKTRWDRQGNGLQLQVSIPANTTATLHLPTLNNATIRIRENGKVIRTNKPMRKPVNGLQFLQLEKDAALFTLGSGEYSFVVE
jgi:alpha-L-rhamnosidase